MDENDARYLATFATWLARLPEDVLMLSQLLGDQSKSREARVRVASALNYLFKSLDLIDDGIESLGFLDDAFVLRVAVAQAELKGEPEGRLSEEAGILLEFLGDLAPRLHRYVKSIEGQAVRGRTAAAIVDGESLLADFRGDLAAWAARYEKPAFVQDERNLVKLRSFLASKLPA